MASEAVVAGEPTPLPRIRDADALAAWFCGAAPGDKCVYHVGVFLPQVPLVAAAKAMVGTGEALPVQYRRADRSFDYVVIKRANRDPAPTSRGPVREDEPRLADEEAEWLLAVLRRLATASKPCPTNAQLANLALLKDAESVRYRLGLLAVAGKIEIATPPQGPRIVTICSTGRKTAKS